MQVIEQREWEGAKRSVAYREQSICIHMLVRLDVGVRIMSLGLVTADWITSMFLENTMIEK